MQDDALTTDKPWKLNSKMAINKHSVAATMDSPAVRVTDKTQIKIVPVFLAHPV